MRSVTSALQLRFLAAFSVADQNPAGDTSRTQRGARLTATSCSRFVLFVPLPSRDIKFYYSITYGILLCYARPLGPLIGAENDQLTDGGNGGRGQLAPAL